MILQAILLQAEKAGLRQYISGRYYYHDISSTSKKKKEQKEDYLWKDEYEQKEYIDIFLPHDLNFEAVNKINAIKFQAQQKFKTKAQINVSRSEVNQSKQFISIEGSNSFEFEQIAEIIKPLSKINSVIKNKKQSNLFELQVLIEASIKKGRVAYQLRIDLCICEQDKFIENQIKQLVPSLNIKFNTKMIKFEEVPKQHETCRNCKKQLTQYPIYWCRWSPKPSNFVCVNCVHQEQNTWQCNENIILLMRPTERIAVTHMGNNLQPCHADKKQLKPHQFVCNNCQKSQYEVGQPRYVCLACNIKPQQNPNLYDLCEECIRQEMEENGDIKFSQMNEQGHLKGIHPFLRINHNANDYLNY